MTAVTPPLIQALVDERLLDQEQALSHQLAARELRQSLVRYLVTERFLEEHKLATTLARFFELPFVDLDTVNIHHIPQTLLSPELIAKYHMAPLYQRNNVLFLATDDPSNETALKTIQFQTGLPCRAVVVESQKLSRFITNLLQQEAPTKVDNNDAPVVSFINHVLEDAIKTGASDIHFEPYDNHYRIRYRLDGFLKEVNSPLPEIHAQISARLKIMANLDISERRLPQDGRFQIKLPQFDALDFRVSTCPVNAGEKVVLRLLDSRQAFCLNQLGMTAHQETLFLMALSKPQGLILVTGPTGCGKTRTLYAALNHLNTKEVNIVTAEDPIEMKLPGINQVNINPKTGLTFARVLRAFLRQDPDIIMVGEIRDQETAEMAIKAAETGHLVLSTLHTNSAEETLKRLLSLGIPAFALNSALSLLIAQRLVRTLCPHCKIPDKLSEDGCQIYRASSCPACNQGYLGRLGLFECLPISQHLEHDLSDLSALKTLKKESLQDAALSLLKQGLTSREEIHRVTVYES